MGNSSISTTTTTAEAPPPPAPKPGPVSQTDAAYRLMLMDTERIRTEARVHEARRAWMASVEALREYNRAGIPASLWPPQAATEYRYRLGLFEAHLKHLQDVLQHCRTLQLYVLSQDRLRTHTEMADVYRDLRQRYSIEQLEDDLVTMAEGRDEVEDQWKALNKMLGGSVTSAAPFSDREALDLQRFLAAETRVASVAAAAVTGARADTREDEETQGHPPPVPNVPDLTSLPTVPTTIPTPTATPRARVKTKVKQVAT